MSCDVPMYAVDLAIVIEHMVLAATDEGLGSCWIGAFSQDKARKALGVPDKYKVVTILPVGYAAGEGVTRAKKPLAEIVTYEKFSE
jgi:nitroreductase